MTENYIFPESMAACADLLYVRRQQRLEADKVAKELKKEETALEEWIINHLPKSDATGAAGHIARVQTRTETVPSVKKENWPKVWKYIKKNDAWELLQKRISKEAVKDRWQNGEEIPGVDHYSYQEISLHKVGA